MKKLKKVMTILMLFVLFLGQTSSVFGFVLDNPFFVYQYSGTGHGIPWGRVFYRNHEIYILQPRTAGNSAIISGVPANALAVCLEKEKTIDSYVNNVHYERKIEKLNIQGFTKKDIKDIETDLSYIYYYGYLKDAIGKGQSKDRYLDYTYTQAMTWEYEMMKIAGNVTKHFEEMTKAEITAVLDNIKGHFSWQIPSAVNLSVDQWASETATAIFNAINQVKVTKENLGTIKKGQTLVSDTTVPDGAIIDENLSSYNEDEFNVQINGNHKMTVTAKTNVDWADLHDKTFKIIVKNVEAKTSKIPISPRSGGAPGNEPIEDSVPVGSGEPDHNFYTTESVQATAIFAKPVAERWEFSFKVLGVGDVEIEKLDTHDGDGVQGVKYHVTFDDGTDAKNVTTGANGKVKIEDVVDGTKVTIQETSVPKPWLIDTTSKTVTAKAGQTVGVEFKNPRPTYSMKLSKELKDYGKLLPNENYAFDKDLTFIITDDNDNNKIVYDNVRLDASGNWSSDVKRFTRGETKVDWSVREKNVGIQSGQLLNNERL